MKIEDVELNMLVTHPKYGGFARLLSVDEGYLPNQYVATVKFGVNNQRVGRAKYSDVYELPLGQLEPVNKPKPADPIESMTPEELLAAIQALDEELSNV